MMNSRQPQSPRVAVAALLLLAGLGLAGYWVHQNYEIRLVRVGAPGDAAVVEMHSDHVDAVAVRAANDRPPPIIVRLACVDASAAMRSVKATRRTLREQLRQGSARAPQPQPARRCRPDAGALADFAAAAGQQVQP